MKFWQISFVLAIMLILLLAGGGGYTQAQEEAIVSVVVPPTNPIGPAVLEIQIDCPGACAVVAFEMVFDPAILRVDDLLRGPYLGSDATVNQVLLDNLNGSVRIQMAAPAAPPPDAPPSLAYLNVMGLAEGSTMLEFASLEITDPDGNVIPARGAPVEFVVGPGGGEAAAPPAEAPTEAVEQLAFVSERDGNPEIYLINSDGTNPQRLTDNPAVDEFPSWSPDGTQIAFASNRSGNLDIYVMNADGSDAQAIAADPADDAFPAWSPDGARIAFMSTRGGTEAIYLMNTDGSDVVALTGDDSNNTMPAWSPDGSQLAFVSDRDGLHEIYLMNADGSDPVRLTRGFGADSWFPAWSPDGARIAFVYERDGQDELFTVTPDGEDLQPLDESIGRAGRLDWSPDGTLIAFAGGAADDADSDLNLFVAGMPVEDAAQVTAPPGSNFAPDWRPVMPVVAAPEPGEQPVASGPAVACEVWTDGAEVAIRVGAGANRGVFNFLTPGEHISVLGQNSDTGAVWFLIDKNALTDDPTVISLWVAADEVNTEGDCAQVAQVDNSGVVFAPPTTDDSGGEDVPLGEWGACGSCDTCGGEATECQINPQGECVWNPQVCGFDMPSAPPPSSGSGSTGGTGSGGSGPAAPVAAFSWYVDFVSPACNHIRLVNNSQNAATWVWGYGDGQGGNSPAPGTSTPHDYPYRLGTYQYVTVLNVWSEDGTNAQAVQTVTVTCP